MKVDELIAATKSNDDIAYTLCRLIDAVGHEIRDDWDWNWLEKLEGRYAAAIDPSVLSAAWKLLSAKHCLSLQTISDDERKISTIAPLVGLVALESLVLQNNILSDLRPLTCMIRLHYLNFFGNCVTDIRPLESLHSLESLHIGSNPIDSLAPLQPLPTLRTLSISNNQVGALLKCKRLSSLLFLKIYDGDPIPDFTQFPEMPGLKVLRVHRARNISGIDQFPSLTTVHLSSGTFTNLDVLGLLKNLTHVDVYTSQPVNLLPLKNCYALRSVKVHAPQISGLGALENLPALHQVHFNDESKYDRKSLKKLERELSGWSQEFAISNPTRTPSLDLRVVTQEEFDYFDGKKDYGIRPGECEDGMFLNERVWLVDEIEAALEPHFEVGECADLNMPYMGGLRRSDRLILYSLHAYESLRQIALIVQEVLCRAHNDWIIYLQALIDEGPDAEEIPDDTQNFVIWVYPDKILTTAEDAETVRKLIEF